MRTISAAALLVLVVLSCFSSTSPAQAQTIDDDATRLEAWVHALGETGEDERRWSSQLQLTLGAGLIGIGAWHFADPTALGASGVSSVIDQRFVFGPLALGVGIINAALGIVGLAGRSHYEDLRARWAVASRDGLDARQLGLFEGELQALATQAKSERIMSIVAGLANIVAGAAIMIATPLAPDLSSADQAMYYGWGGGLAASGLLVTLVSVFTQAPAEEAWEAYRAGHFPE